MWLAAPVEAQLGDGGLHSRARFEPIETGELATRSGGLLAGMKARATTDSEREVLGVKPAKAAGRKSQASDELTFF